MSSRRSRESSWASGKRQSKSRTPLALATVARATRRSSLDDDLEMPQDGSSGPTSKLTASSKDPSHPSPTSRSIRKMREVITEHEREGRETTASSTTSSHGGVKRKRRIDSPSPGSDSDDEERTRESVTRGTEKRQRKAGSAGESGSRRSTGDQRSVPRSDRSRVSQSKDLGSETSCVTSSRSSSSSTPDVSDEKKEQLIVPDMRIAFTTILPQKDTTAKEREIQINFQHLAILLACKHMKISAKVQNGFFEDHAYFADPWDALLFNRGNAAYNNNRLSWNRRYVEDLLNRFPCMSNHPVSSRVERGCDLCGKKQWNMACRMVVLSGSPYSEKTLAEQAVESDKRFELTLGTVCCATFEHKHDAFHCLFTIFNDFYRRVFPTFLGEADGIKGYYIAGRDIVDIDAMANDMMKDSAYMSIIPRALAEWAELNFRVDPHRNKGGQRLDKTGRPLHDSDFAQS